MTVGVTHLGVEFQTRLLEALAAFDDFDPDNDRCRKNSVDRKYGTRRTPLHPCYFAAGCDRARGRYRQMSWSVTEHLRAALIVCFISFRIITYSSYSLRQEALNCIFIPSAAVALEIRSRVCC
jgi:hypothetical protein